MMKEAVKWWISANKFFFTSGAGMAINPAIFAHKRKHFIICHQIINMKKRFAAAQPEKCTSLILAISWDWGVPVSTRQCPWWDARHGRPNSIEYLVLHATWWPGRMVHTLVLHPQPGDSSMAHHQQSLPLSLSQDGDGGNREKHSGQDRQLMIQGRICLKGHIWKAFSNCIRRQLYHNNVLLYVGTIRQAILAPFVTIIEL